MTFKERLARRLAGRKFEELEAMVARAWNEGAQAEAEARDGEDAITSTCSTDNPYYEWIPSSWHPGAYHARPRIPGDMEAYRHRKS